ncbi:glycosyltransferase family 2 protein [Pyrobaculum neutrophilum]|uniref:Glycosyl transferase family 2 n=1 Tax=Pyrobaculum neutrophilum (strain DSM 2338 / JCM 9278 / NBRC 100436 / V24Sta) TaxID=444157 RepID=B1YCC2_PYRNV|nr:glycosyltransferase family 2 protein [Pyrobaculum neutrophilum]ACB39435.1 glycosyl transferase family 2 [Pyrobaculum neutrophilum V24Sta]
MSVRKYPLVYLASPGLVLLVVTMALILITIDKFNESRIIDTLTAASAFLAYVASNMLLSAAIAVYTSTRTSYIPPEMPPIPKAKTVALIPAYNEEGRIGQVVTATKRYVDLVIVVDDGSKDNTAREAQEAGALVIRHPRNMGKGAAVATLIKAALKADAQYAILIDADGQHNPHDIPRMLQPLIQGQADHVVANRFTNTKMPTIRKIGYKALALLHAILIKPMGDPFNGYRAFTRKALELLDREFDPAYGVEIEINNALRRLRTTEVTSKVIYHEKSSKANMLIQGLNLAWAIIWTTITKSPKITILAAVALYTASTALLIHAINLFNVTRYMRLIYTTLALTLPVIATQMIAATLATHVRK